MAIRGCPAQGKDDDGPGIDEVSKSPLDVGVRADVPGRRGPTASSTAECDRTWGHQEGVRAVCEYAELLPLVSYLSGVSQGLHSAPIVHPDEFATPVRPPSCARYAGPARRPTCTRVRLARAASRSRATRRRCGWLTCPAGYVVCKYFS